MSTDTQKLDGIAFLAFPEQTELLLSELKNRFGFEDLPDERYGELLYFANKQLFLEKSAGQYPYWARTVMTEPFILQFDSIGEAAASLKALQRNWAPYQYTCFRRAQLIQEKLPYINLKDRQFPVKIPASPIGLYTLLDEHTLIASAQTTSFLPAGSLHFIEDHENPPSRAYLKVQESLTMAQLLLGAELPGTGQKCFEAGACPGGWTWVLVGLGAEVYAVDRAELAPELMKNPLVKFQAHDAFTLKPQEIGPVDWVFSDVICYPERLLKWITTWLESGLTNNMICTIKMQGEIDWPLIAEFANIPGSRIIHLNYNKHELTWMWTNANTNTNTNKSGS
jgi:23S rRNA (cytidine2498-2'-O)-methyltransferase